MNCDPCWVRNCLHPGVGGRRRVLFLPLPGDGGAAPSVVAWLLQVCRCPVIVVRRVLILFIWTLYSAALFPHQCSFFV